MPKAVLSHFPVHSGDGFGWGGEPVISFGPLAIQLGEGQLQEDLAQEIVRRWNALEPEDDQPAVSLGAATGGTLFDQLSDDEKRRRNRLADLGYATPLTRIANLRSVMEDIAVYGCGMLNQPIAMNGPEEVWLKKRIRAYERRVREALADDDEAAGIAGAAP